MTSIELKEYATQILKDNLTDEQFDRRYGLQFKKSEEEKAQERIDREEKKKQKIIDKKIEEEKRIEKINEVSYQLISYLSEIEETISIVDAYDVYHNDFLYSVANYLNKNTTLSKKQEAAAISTMLRIIKQKDE